jgi:hypothetical protein
MALTAAQRQWAIDVANKIAAGDAGTDLDVAAARAKMCLDADPGLCESVVTLLIERTIEEVMEERPDLVEQGSKAVADEAARRFAELAKRSREEEPGND